MKLAALLLPHAVVAAVLLPRQTPNNGGLAYSGWASPDHTYDGLTVLGTFPSSNTDNASAPGITHVDPSNGSQGSQQLNITVQNLTPTLRFQNIFAAVHSDRIRLFEVGKPASNELTSFVVDGNGDAFTSLNMDNIYGYTTVSSLIAPGQYYNFSLPLSLPSQVQSERLADALDDLDASLTVVGRFAGVSQGFFAVNAMDLGDRFESDSAAAYSTASGFLTYHTGTVNDTAAFFAGDVATVLSLAE